MTSENIDDPQLRNNVRFGKIPVAVFFQNARRVFKWDTLGQEILGIAFPAALGVAADPIASLIDIAFVGHLGPVELAAVGVSIAIFNQASRITIFPLVSITTSFVAEEDTISGMKVAASKHNQNSNSGALKGPTETSEVEDLILYDKPKADDHDDEENNETRDHQSLPEGPATSLEAVEKETSKACDGTDNGTKIAKNRKKVKKNMASASTALIFGSILGLLQAIFLIFGAKFLLWLMGVKESSPMLAPARKYLVLRSLGAPAVLLSLAIQGIFRGFKDTKTPLYVIVFGYTINIILDPIFIFLCGWGVRGAAIAHVLSQYLIVLVLMWRLMQKISLLPPSLSELQFGRFLKNGSLLLARVVAVTFCVTLAASLAARLGPTPMAAFQTCLQIWMTSSLLSDGLAVAGQAILASSFAEKDYDKTTATAVRVLQMGFVLGVGLTVFVGFGMFFGAGVFSRDIHVQQLIHIGMPFVAATQPINSLAFVFDGVNFGASDFAYSAISLILVGIASIISLFLLSKSNGFVGIWIALTIYMTLRTFVGVWRMGTGTGPWCYLRGLLLP